MRAVKGSCKRSPCRGETERECVCEVTWSYSHHHQTLWWLDGATHLFQALKYYKMKMLIEFLVLTTWKLLLEHNPRRGVQANILPQKSRTQVDWTRKVSIQVISPGLWISSYILFTCNSINFYWIFQLSLCVKSEGSIYLSLDPRSLPGTRNWSTLENIWDFTTLGSHILHRGGILCPLNSAVEGGTCLFSLLFIFLFSMHFSILSVLNPDGVYRQLHRR